jgi:hypothetical protein
LENTGYSSFTPKERLPNALLWLQKAYSFASNMTNATKMCLRTAVQTQSRTDIVQKPYFDEFCRAQYHYLYENQGYKGGLVAFKLNTVGTEVQLGGYMALLLKDSLTTSQGIKAVS